MPNMRAAILAGVLGMAATFAVRAQPACGAREPGDTRPRIGLALGGGGARGIAHVSVLREIEAQRIPIDCIAGTSMGALAGGLYASGMSVDAMEHLVTSTDWKRLFDDSIPRAERSYRRKQDDRDALATVGIGLGGPRGLKVSPGVLQGERILAMFERTTIGASGIERFDDLPIPFRAVATDLNTGEAVVLDHGSLPMAMRASMSLPGIFQPVEIGGRVLIDGGVANQVPVDVLRAMGADIVIAVDVGTPLDTLGRDASLLEVVSQISGMLTTGNTRRALATLGERDVLIVPALGAQVGTGDFDKATLALEIGRRAAVDARPRLAALSVDDTGYRLALDRRPKPATAPPVVAFVRLHNATAYADELLLSRLDITVGAPLDAEALGDRVLGVYGLGTLASITYEVAREGDRTGVVVHARPKPQGPNYLQLGMTLSNDFAGGHDSNLRAGVLFSPLSPFGAEARVIAQIGSEPGLTVQYYHPFDVGNRNLFAVEGRYENPNIRLYDEAGHNVATYDVRSTALEARVAREFGNYGAIGVGAMRATGRARVQTGDPSLPPIDFDTGRLSAFANIDRLDSLFFPRNGYSGLLSYTIARDWLGSDADYGQVDFELLGARAFGRSAVQAGVSWHVTTQGTLPLQDRYRIGGRGRLAGFRSNERTGQHYAIVFLGYTWQLAEVFGRSAMIGSTLEYGNAWEDRADMAWRDGIFNASLYAGFDSWVGPMLFGYGWREGGEGVLFLEIGKPF